MSGKKTGTCTDSQGGGDQLNSSGLLSQGDSLAAEQDTIEGEPKASAEIQE